MNLIDTHCHIYYDKYNDDIDQVISRSKKHNISNIICVGVDLESSKQSIELAEKYDIVYATAGYHPHDSKDASEYYLNDLKKLAKNPKVVAIGEMGLDYFYNHSDKQIQIHRFEEQLNLAKELDLPAIIHNRESDSDLYNILQSLKINKGVIHCFSSTIDFAYQNLDLGLLLSFTGIVTFSDDLKKVVQEIPLNKMMLETDSPYLTPKPFRGKRNEPYMVNFIAEEIAKIKNISKEEVANKTTQTAKDFFGI